MIVEFEIGDWSGDGHMRTDTYMYECVHPRFRVERENVIQAYQAGCTKLGFDLVIDCCAQYEETHLSEGQMDKLVSLGFVHEDLEEMRDWVNTDWWMEIYIFICKLGSPEISFTQVQNQNIRIGGYGLFS